MINKFRTPLVTVAFRVNPKLPRELQQSIEIMLNRLAAIMTSAYTSPEAFDRFCMKLNEYCKEEFLELIKDDDVKPKFTPPPSVCEDWKRGLRTPHGTCTNCGGKH